MTLWGLPCLVSVPNTRLCVRSHPLLLFVLIDRGGASVETDAVDRTTGQRLATLTLAASGLLGKSSAQFSRFARAEAALRRSVMVFMTTFGEGK